MTDEEDSTGKDEFVGRHCCVVPTGSAEFFPWEEPIMLVRGGFVFVEEATWPLISDLALEHATGITFMQRMP